MLEAMLEKVEYLMVDNQMRKVLKLICTLRDQVAAGNVKVPIPVDPITMEIRDLAPLERECEVLMPNAEGRINGKGRDRDLNSTQGIHSPTG